MEENEQRFLLCFDIASSKNRVKLVKYLYGYGVRVQKSVFELILSSIQADGFKMRLSSFLSSKQDSIRMYPIFKAAYQTAYFIGRQVHFDTEAYDIL